MHRVMLKNACRIRQYSQLRWIDSNRKLSVTTITDILKENGSCNGNVQEITKCIDSAYKAMTPTLFVYSISHALCHLESAISENQKIYSKIMEKLRDVKRDDVFLSSRKVEENVEDLDNLLAYVFNLALSIDKPSCAYKIIIHLLENASKSSKTSPLLDARNISILIDSFSVNRSQEMNVRDLDMVFNLLDKYNATIEDTDLKRFELSDEQIRNILDKASCTLVEDVISLQGKKSFNEKRVYKSPYSTLEVIIKDLGFLLSQRISPSVSYYKQKPQKYNESVINERFESSLKEILDRQILNKYLHFCYSVIRERCSNNDPVMVYSIWCLIKPFHNKIYNSTISSENNNLSNNFYYYQTLSKMITLFSKAKRYRKLIDELLFDLPLDSVKVCPELMSSILYHCGRTKNKSLGEVVGSRYDNSSTNLDKVFGNNGDLSILNTGEKFTPGQVHAFLAYSLRIGDQERAFEIIDYLQYKMIGFSSIDFNELIGSVLYKASNDGSNTDTNLKLAWELICNNDKNHKKELNKYALITYLDYMVNLANKKQIGKSAGDLDFDRVDKIYSMLVSISSFDDIEFWDHFYMSYFKYIIRKYPLKIIKDIYENCMKFTEIHYKDCQKRNKRNSKPQYNDSTSNYFAKLADYSHAINPFNLRYNHVRIALSDNLRTLILKDIYQCSDRYKKRATHFKSEDLKDAVEQHRDISQWVHEELSKVKHNYNLKNKQLVKDSVTIDLMKTINKGSRKIGFESKQTKKRYQISENERNYRIEKGEKIAIGNISLAEEFYAMSKDLKERWGNDSLVDKKRADN